ncbi:hypothetical protein SAMN04488128_103714 [Chitinophaga eiseniae]|uniref:Uncharacterized protein n=1 Tax=Chitinophaga eiseniae TaxID=634771 RepID=A0A1T4SXW6_9BACT|nr:hypothetical protein [Chitinophaga eiseniae]SKA32758.1 hypothetical protein SAMN04488128_103714 [Chitinophaga eiseniae]
MAFGYHQFYALSVADQTRKERGREHYFLGSFLGDHANDEVFKDKIGRLLARLTKRFGISDYSYHWAPYHTKPYRPRTALQKYRAAVRKAENKHRQAVGDIFVKYPLFADTLLLEQEDKLKECIELLKQRYNVAAQ